jgi:hypothetical protein
VLDFSLENPQRRNALSKKFFSRKTTPLLLGKERRAIIQCVH